MIEIIHRYTKAVLYRSEDATTVREAMVAAVASRANLADANLAGANQVIAAGTPTGWRCVGYLRDGWLSVRVGCHDKRLPEARTYWAGKADRREVLAALDYLETVARLRSWTTAAPAGTP